MERIGDAARRLLAELDARIAERTKAAGRLKGPAQIQSGRDDTGCFPIPHARPAPDTGDDVEPEDRAERTAPCVLIFPMRPVLGALAGAAVPRMPQGRPSTQAHRAGANDNVRDHARHHVLR